MDWARIVSKLREQIVQFSGELSAGCPKVVQRFVAEMLYGIQARQSLRLTEISRALGEKVSVKKNVERLSRQLGRRGLWRVITGRLLKMAARRVFGILDFRLYALADGIKHFLFSQSKGLKLAMPPPKPHFVQRFPLNI